MVPQQHLKLTTRRCGTLGSHPKGTNSRSQTPGVQKKTHPGISANWGILLWRQRKASEQQITSDPHRNWRNILRNVLVIHTKPNRSAECAWNYSFHCSCHRSMNMINPNQIYHASRSQMIITLVVSKQKSGHSTINTKYNLLTLRGASNKLGQSDRGDASCTWIAKWW